MGTIDGSAQSNYADINNIIDLAAQSMVVAQYTTNYIIKMLNRNTYSKWSLVSEGRHLVAKSWRYFMTGLDNHRAVLKQVQCVGDYPAF